MKNRSHLRLFTLVSLFVTLLMTVGFAHPIAAQDATPEATVEPLTKFKVIGYFVQWGIYDRNYRVKQVETSGAAERMTHINYAFANVSTDFKCYEETKFGWGDAYADYGWMHTDRESVDGKGDTFDQKLKGHFNQLKKLKAMHPQLKLMLSIGGWSWSGRFSDAAMPEHREAFVKSCVDLFIRGDLPVLEGNPAGGKGTGAGLFDGIDIDWEYPAAPGFEGDPARNLPPNVYRPEDTQNFTALLAEFRKQLDAYGKETGQHYLLSIAAPAGADKYEKMELEKIHQYLDYINVMTYDYHGAWDPKGPTNFHAPLYASDDDPSPLPQRTFSIDDTITAYLGKGIPAEKLMMGIPFYGRGWAGVPDKNHGLYQSASDMRPAPGKYEAGNDDYKRIKSFKGYTGYHDPKTKAYWIFNGSTFWSFDDPESIAAKTEYIKNKGLGGVMFWSVDGDDGTLIRAIYDGLK